MEATIHIHTFKEGLLSKLAHDLRLSVTRFDINVRGLELSARFELESLRVDGSVRGGKLDRAELSDADRKKIRETMLRDVLRARDHGEARFTGRTHSREPPFAVEGSLTLAGVTKPLSLLLLPRGGRLVAEVELVPSQWGIKPYRALGGALRVQDRVLVSIDASAEWLAEGQELNPAVELVWTPAVRPSVLRSSLKPGA